MTDTAWIAFGAALGGALVGGAATAVGSFLVGRNERRHAVWAKLYLDLLPEFDKASPPDVRPLFSDGRRTKIELLTEIRRTADLGGRACWQQAGALSKAFRVAYPPEDAEEPTTGFSGEATSSVDRSLDLLNVHICATEFDIWLSTRVGGGGKFSYRPSVKRWSRRAERDRKADRRAEQKGRWRR